MAEGVIAGVVVFTMLVFFAFSVVAAVISFIGALVALAIRIGTVVLVVGFAAAVAAMLVAAIGGTSLLT